MAVTFQTPENVAAESVILIRVLARAKSKGGGGGIRGSHQYTTP